MKFMNDYDIETAQYRFSQGSTPNREKVADIVAKLADWADSNSDGWAFWPKPAKAAAKAMDLIDPQTNADYDRMYATDATEAEVKAALSPIKSFLTRNGVAHSEIFE
jgi:hypothetical protein